MHVSPHALGLCALVFVTAACRQDLSFPLPPQQVSAPYFARVMLDMTPGMPAPWGAMINSGVDKADPNLNWRWLTRQSSFSFELEDRSDWQLDLHLTAVDQVITKVGPQRLKVLVNGLEVSRAALDKPGPVYLSYPVQAGQKPTVELHIEPCLPQPYGTPYCALLHAVGFSRELK